MIKENKVPSNWCHFLRHNDNKTDLFHSLADKIAHMTMANMFVVTKEPVLSFSETSLDSLDKCFHEEADRQIFVHARYAMEEGSKTIIMLLSLH